MEPLETHVELYLALSTKVRMRKRFITILRNDFVKFVVLLVCHIALVPQPQGFVCIDVRPHADDTF